MSRGDAMILGVLIESGPFNEPIKSLHWIEIEPLAPTRPQDMNLAIKFQVEAHIANNFGPRSRLVAWTTRIKEWTALTQH